MNVATTTISGSNQSALFDDSRTSVSSYKSVLYAVVFFFLALSIKVSLGIQTTKIGYYSGHEMERTLNLRMQRQELELELSVLLKEEDLALRAKKELGLRDASSEQILLIK